MTEAAVQQQIRLAAPQYGCYLWRNNSGALLNERGDMVRYGLGNDSKKLNDEIKSADLIGVAPGGRFLAVECKAPGWRLTPGDARAQAQAKFLRLVRRAGGLAGFATGVSDFAAILAGSNEI